MKLFVPADPGQQTLTLSSASDLHFLRGKGIFNLNLSTVQFRMYSHEQLH